MSRANVQQELLPVETLHERTKKGIRFNVQKVDSPSPIDKYYFDKFESNFASFLGQFYEDRLLPTEIEVSSLTKASRPLFTARGFMQVALSAFAWHYPLIIRPDDIWLLLSYSFGKHVVANAEALRKNFVSHTGKKNLEISVDHFVMGKMTPEDWERDVFPEFSSQIRKNIGESTHTVIASPFTTSTPTDKAAHEITLMTAMKEYFTYSMTTACGIPWIELQGTLEDWENILNRANTLYALMVPEIGSKWASVLNPVLEEFISAYKGTVNQRFWQVMCKYVQHGRGSGAYETVSGWLTLFYLELSQYHKSWRFMESSDGPLPEKFPTVISSTPVLWVYHGIPKKLHFHAGFLGASLDSNTSALQSEIGWFVSHDPPTEPKERVAALKSYLERIKSSPGYSPEDWNFKYRVTSIEKTIAQLESGKPVTKEEYF